VCGATSAVARYCNLARLRPVLPNRVLGRRLIARPGERGLSRPQLDRWAAPILPTPRLNVVRSAVSLAPVVVIVCCVLRRKKFRFGHAVQVIQGGLLDVDVLADHLGGDAGVPQPQCQRIR
jgi:hypothetical protein